MGTLVPIRNITAEEIGPDELVCELDGGRIVFARHDGKWSADVFYDDEPNHTAHVGPFCSLDDAGYGLTHGYIPRKLASLLIGNGILEKR